MHCTSESSIVFAKDKSGGIHLATNIRGSSTNSANTNCTYHRARIIWSKTYHMIVTVNRFLSATGYYGFHAASTRYAIAATTATPTILYSCNL